MALKTIAVKAIVAGYEFRHALQVSGTSDSLRDLTGARVVGHVKKRTSDTTPLVVLDTNAGDGSLTVTASDTLELKFTAAQTNTFPTYTGHVVVDFVRMDGAQPEPLPFVIQWPIRKPVTKLV
jgi:hypothetical protein